MCQKVEYFVHAYTAASVLKLMVLPKASRKPSCVYSVQLTFMPALPITMQSCPQHETYPVQRICAVHVASAFEAIGKTQLASCYRLAPL